jgi:hypothetical protein
VKLFIDILRLKDMMTDMNGCRKTKAGSGVPTAIHGCLQVSGRQRTNGEVSVTKVLTAVVAAALVIVVLIGGARAWASGRDNSAADRQGMMPVVTVSAEMPRLVMPTVEVHAVRMVAMSGSDLRVY